MRIGRTLPPAAAPISGWDILSGCKGQFRGRTECERFIAELKAYFRVEHAFLLSSGRAALTIILRAMKRVCPDRDEVLIPSFTCYSVPSSVVRAGLRVRLVDINPETLDYDRDSLVSELHYSRRLLAVVCPHLFGLPADIARVQSLLKDSAIRVIDDAAQAMGSVFGGRYAGTLGDIGFCSLGRGKAFSAVEGGIILTHSNLLAEQIRSCMGSVPPQTAGNQLKLAGYATGVLALMHPALFWIPKSLPALRLGETVYDPKFLIKRFSAFQAGLTSGWQLRLAAFQAARRENARFWKDALKRFSWLTPITPRKADADKDLPLLRFPAMVENTSLRDKVLQASNRHGLGIMPSYPDSVDRINGLHIVSEGKRFTGAQKCVDCLVTFPVHGLLAPRDRRKALEILEKIRK